MSLLHALVDGAVVAGLLAAVFLVVERLLPRRPGILAGLWGLALAAFLVAPWLVRSPVRQEASVALLSPGGADLDHGWLARGMLWMTRTCGSSWSAWVEGALLLGLAGIALGSIAREVARTRALARALRAAGPADASTRALAEGLARELGLAPVETVVLEPAPAPFLWSLGAPRIVVPREFSPGARASLLAHELAHHRRHDAWFGGLEFAVGLLQAWNPLFHLIVRRRRAWAERACDAWATRLCPSERGAYARALLETAARGAEAPRAAAVSGSLGGAACELRARLSTVLDRRDSPGGSWIGALLGGPLLLTAGLSTPAAASWLPAYPRVTSGEAILVQAGVETWEELELRSRSRLVLDPDDEGALRLDGMALLALGRPREAAARFERRAALRTRDPVPRYNAACAWSRAAEVDRALASLAEACRGGAFSAVTLRLDPDLAAVRGKPRFEALVRELDARARAASGSERTRGTSPAD